MKSKIPDKWFYIPVILLGIYFIIRLVNQSKIISIFPLDYTNDIASYMAQLFFLGKCGFHNFCPYWYNGFITFKLTTPGWYFFTYPVYLITNNVQISAFISMILIYIIGFVLIWYFGKYFKFSKIKKISFFLFFFANAIAIGNFIRLGRLHGLLAWTIFIAFTFILLIYKDKQIDKKFFWIILPYSLIILTHQTVTILASLSLLSLFLIKNNLKEKLKIIAVLIISLAITTFWWVPYTKVFLTTKGADYALTATLLIFDKNHIAQNIATFLIPVIFWVIFYFYWKSYNKSKKELLFFIIPIILSILLFTRLLYFIPILKYVYPDSYNYLLILLSIFMFFKIDFSILRLKKLIPFLLALIVIVSIGVNIFYTPNFAEYTKLEKETITMLEKVSDPFLLIGSPSHTSYSNAYYAYAPVKLNLSTPGGWYPELKEKSYIDLLYSANSLLKEKNCGKLIEVIINLNATEIISFDEHCQTLKDCRFKLKEQSERVCLYEND